MTSDINICNMALGNIGAAPIVSFSDESQTARICASYYEHVRKYLLSAYPWSFNRRHVRLVQLPKDEESEESEDELVSVYAYPTEALYINGVYSKEFPGLRISYDVRLGKEGKRRLLVRVPGPLFADCRADVKDVSVWPAVFCEIIAWALSMRIALALTKDEGVASNCNAMYLQALGRALCESANEPDTPLDGGSSWLEAREI